MLPSFDDIHSQVSKMENKKSAADDAVVEEEETLTHAETFANYQPAKLKIGQSHPDPVVETSSLSSVQPPRIWYELALPEATIDSGSISALQLEAVVYSCQRHERFLANGERAGFLIGDGAGVGKGEAHVYGVNAWCGNLLLAPHAPCCAGGSITAMPH